jgi:glycosyltransferase involved in cell wall biosynthesis
MVGSGPGTVSVVVPTFYRNDLLAEAVDSALAQEYEPVEVVVVDDSGDAHAEPVVDRYDAVEYVPLPENVGENRARDAGLEATSGEYVQFLDDDDLLRPDKLDRQVPLLDDGTGVVYSGLRYHESGDVLSPDPAARGDVLDAALRFDLWPPCFTSSLLIDRSVLERVRPLRHHGAGDTTFLIGLARRTEFDYVDAPLVEKRLGVDSLGFSLANVRNKRQLLAEHTDLYDRHPDCRATAVTHVNSQEGRVRLDRFPWSPRAVAAFGRAAYYAPENRSLYVARFLASLFGRPGFRALGWASNYVSLAGSGET